jgi:hypothetical protein
MGEVVLPGRSSYRETSGHQKSASDRDCKARARLDLEHGRAGHAISRQNRDDFRAKICDDQRCLHDTGDNTSRACPGNLGGQFRFRVSAIWLSSWRVGGVFCGGKVGAIRITSWWSFRRSDDAYVVGMRRNVALNPSSW